MNGLACVSVLNPIVKASGWEILHRSADGAVILAVIVGLIELWSHRRERREQTAAIDDHIRALASQAFVQVNDAIEAQAQYSQSPATRLMTRGTELGDSMAICMTTIAAQAPRASRSLRVDARNAAKGFFAMTIVLGLAPDDPDARRAVDSLRNVLSLLKVAPDRPAPRRGWKLWRR